MLDPFVVSTGVVGDTITVSASGELDVDTQGRLRSELESALHSAGKGGLVVLDLTDLSFMGSVGLGVLVVIHRMATRSGTRFEIIEPASMDGVDVFAISGLDKILPLSRRREESNLRVA
jgi:anti-anti-sigma factor